MPRKSRSTGTQVSPAASAPHRPSALLDTRVIYCGDNLDQLKRFPDACVDLIYIDPPFNSNRNYEVFWGETKEKRAFEDRHASMAAYIYCTRPRRPRVCSRYRPPIARAAPAARHWSILPNGCHLSVRDSG
jgi:hypothetical protein